MSNVPNKLIAVLITCYNRKEITRNCLQNLMFQQLPEGFNFKIFLVDDGSTDGTSLMVENEFSAVELIQGSGQLYWNGGMRLAWEYAAKEDPDFYLWLNDDVTIENNAIKELFDCYDQGVSESLRSCLITGACKNSLENEEFSYGGRTEDGPVLPNGKIQNCKYINGNIVLISREQYNIVGNLSPYYTHGIGDNDYGLRIIEAGFKCYTTKNFIGICSKNEGDKAWYNPAISIRKRWQLFHSPKGLNIKEYNIYRKRFWGWKWLIFACKAYLKMLTPKVYSILSSTTNY